MVDEFMKACDSHKTVAVIKQETAVVMQLLMISFLPFLEQIQWSSCLCVRA